MKKILQRKLPFITLLILFCLSSCIEKRDLSKNLVIFHISSQPDGLHPFNNNSGNRTIVFNYTQKTLIKLDLRTLDYIPDLVESLPEISEDQLRYTYKLKEGIKWDNGEPLTIDDIIFTSKIQVCPLTDNSAIRNIYSNVIGGVEKDPDDPLKFTMIAKDVNFYNPSIYSEIYIQQKSYWDPEGVLDNYEISQFYESSFSPGADLIDWMNEFNNADNSYIPEKLVGLGPYRITDWETKSYITLERKDDWWGVDDTLVYNRSYPDRIIFNIIQDGASTKMALKNEKLDCTVNLGNSSLMKLKKLDYFNENYHSDYLNEYAYAYIGLNMKPESVNRKPFFTDQKVRRAMAHLTPVDEIIDVLNYGRGLRQVSNVSPLKKWYNDKLKPIEFDIEIAKQLLQESGWVDTDDNNIRDKEINGERVQFSFDLNYFGNSQLSKEMALMVKEEMYKAGIEVNTQPMDFNLLYKNAYEHEFDAMFGVWGGGAAPSDPTQLWHTASWVNKGSNFFGFGDAESDSLIELANRTIGVEERTKVLHEFQEKIYNAQPYVFLYSRVRPTIIHRRYDNTGMYNEKPGLIANNLKLKDEYRTGNSTLTIQDM